MPGWVTYPDDDWIPLTPEEAGRHPDKFAAFLKSHDVRGARPLSPKVCNAWRRVVRTFICGPHVKGTKKTV